MKRVTVRELFAIVASIIISLAICLPVAGLIETFFITPSTLLEHICQNIEEMAKFLYIPLAYIIVFAFPTYFILRKYNRLHWHIAVIAGFLIGDVPTMIGEIIAPHKNMLHYTEEIIFPGILFGIIGAVSASITWVIWYMIFGRTFLNNPQQNI